MFVIVGEMSFLGSGAETTSLNLQHFIRKTRSDEFNDGKKQTSALQTMTLNIHLSMKLC